MTRSREPLHKRLLALLLPLTLAGIAVGGALVATKVLADDAISILLGPLRFRSSDSTDAIVIGGVAAVVLLAVAWRRRRWWRIVAWSCLVAIFALCLVSLAKTGHETWPVGDGALIELYTIHALEGHQ